MAKLSPIKHREMVRRLKALGYTGPYSGGKHPYMERGDEVFTIPNNHNGDIGPELQKQIMKRLSINTDTWNNI